MLTSWSELRQCGCGRAAPTADRVYPPDPNGSSRTRSVFQAPPLGALFFCHKVDQVASVLQPRYRDAVLHDLAAQARSNKSGSRPIRSANEKSPGGSFACVSQ